MGWKQDFVQQLQGRGFQVDESMIGRAEAVRDDLRQFAAWYATVDQTTQNVLDFVESVGAGLHFAGFGQRWPNLVTLLGQTDTTFRLRERYNAITELWNAMADRAVNEDQYAGL